MKKKETSLEVFPVSKCPGKLEIPTEDEKECLDQMRRIKGRVKELKALMEERKRCGTGERDDKLLEIEDALKKLKTEWDMWEEKREKAANERMMLLGHGD